MSTRAKKVETKKRVEGVERVERARYQEQLPVRLASTLLVEAGEELAAIVRERASVEAEQREANAAFRKRITELCSRCDNRARAINEGTELRDVEVIEYLVVSTGRVERFRQDTGEQIDSRAAEAADRQESLPLPELSGEAVKAATRARATERKRARRGS